MSIILIKELCKSYGALEVLHNINLSVQRGSLVGFLGPNGAGKTTTIRILLGLIRPSRGRASVFGLDCQRDGKSIRQRIGYLPGDVRLYSSMSGLSTLQHFARVRRVNCDAEITRLAERFQLPLNRTVRKYSTGMKQKLGLIQALMHCPELLVLDEPTSALDPLIRASVFDELRDHAAAGKTVLFSSHSLDEVDELCDHVVILRQGQIVEQQSIRVLREKALRKVRIQFQSPADVPTNLPESLQLLAGNDDVISCTWTGDVEGLLNWVASYRIVDLIIERPDLNDLFLAYYAGKRDGSAMGGNHVTPSL